MGLVFLCDHNLKQVEKAQQCSKRPLGQWIFPGDTRGPWGCKGEDGACPHPAGWQMNGAGVGVVLRTQPAQRWVPAVQLREGTRRKWLSGRRGPGSREQERGPLRDWCWEGLFGALKMWAPGRGNEPSWLTQSSWVEPMPGAQYEDVKDTSSPTRVPLPSD